MGLEPSSETIFKKATVTTNRWGMRDREYDKQRPPNTTRMAIIGGSSEMGAGVENAEIFEHLVENKLTSEFASDSAHFEILNFAISGSSVFRNIEKLRQQVFKFQPQQVLVFTHKGEDLHINKTLKWLTVGQGRGQHTSDLRDTITWIKDFEKFIQEKNIKYSGIATTEERSETGWKMLDWGYGTMAAMCREKGVELIMVFMPGILEQEGASEPFQRLAQKHDLTFINLSGIYHANTVEELQIAPWDNHPNALGHQLVGDQLYEELVRYLKLEEIDK